MKRTTLKDRVLPKYTKGEELFNMISHIVGGAFAICALVLCVIKAALNHNTMGVVSGAIYGFTMILLYTMSSIYHGLPADRTSKKVFQIIDHCSIFFLIAGTYTPITLCAIRLASPALGWTIFGIIWGAAALGITLNAIDLKKYKIFSMISYIGMGWCIIWAYLPMKSVAGSKAMVLLLIGGVLYTVGAVLYLLGKKHKFMHSIFHLLVLGGSIMHFFCVMCLM